MITQGLGSTTLLTRGLGSSIEILQILLIDPYCKHISPYLIEDGIYRPYVAPACPDV